MLPEHTLLRTEKGQGRKEVPLAGEWAGVECPTVALREGISRRNSTSSPSLTSQGECSSLRPCWSPSAELAPVCPYLFCTGGRKTRCGIWMLANKCWVKGDNSFPIMAQDAVNLLHCQGRLLAPAYRDSQHCRRVFLLPKRSLSSLNLMSLLVCSPGLSTSPLNSSSALNRLLPNLAAPTNMV